MERDHRVPPNEWTWDLEPHSVSVARAEAGALRYFHREAVPTLAGAERWQSFREFFTLGPPAWVPESVRSQIADYLRPYFSELAPPRSGNDECAVCGVLPPSMEYDIDRGGEFPPQTNLLIEDAAGLRHCPRCRRFYLFEDHPQYHGTGTLDTEGYRRLDDVQSTALAMLLLEDATSSSRPRAVAACLKQVGDSLTLRLVRRLDEETREALLPLLLEHLLTSPSSAMNDYFTDLIRLRPKSAGPIAAFIEEQGREPLPRFVQLVLDKARRRCGKATAPTSAKRKSISSRRRRPRAR